MSAAEQTDTTGFTLKPEVSQLCEYDFMRCGKCGRLMTKPEMQKALGLGSDGRACPCGSLKYLPVNVRWFDWMRPRVLSFAYHRLRGTV
jgi:hypothetical protein